MRVLLLLLLASCAYGTRNRPDRDVLDDVADAWADSSLPDADQCFERIEVRRHDTLESYVAACARWSPGIHAEAAAKSAGCLTTALRGPRGVQVGVVELAPGYHDDEGLIQHEALHRACWCAWDDVDRPHSKPAVWTEAGGASSVQSRAR